MGYPLRDEIAGGTYHVFARGVERRRIFVDDKDYENYTGLLTIVTRRQGWNLLCYCLMPNHVHLLIETPEPNLAAGMQRLHSTYALGFNERHVRAGHLFGARYKSPLVASDEAFVTTVGYIVMNPVAAALCKYSADWRWGSHATVTSNRPVPSWLAHERLQDRLEEMTGSRCYAELVATRERNHY